jgi:hypothetical protein
MSATAWSTIASLATALGTLVLAVATFSAVRSSNLMAKIAREQFLVQLRPVLTTSRREDPTLKVNFGDTKWVRIPGGGAVGEVGPGDGSLGPRAVDGRAALRRPRGRAAGDQPVHHAAGRPRGPEPGRRTALAGHREQALEHRPSRPEITRQAAHRESPAGSGGFWPFLRSYLWYCRTLSITIGYQPRVRKPDNP